MNSSRLSILSAAFRDVPLTCGSLTLRPITAGSVLLLMETGNALFSDAPADSGGSDSAMFQALFEFIHIHTAPEAEVIVDCEDPARLRTRAKMLALSISFEDLEAFQARFEVLRQRLNAALVEIVPEKGEGAGKPLAAMPPPTGSPPSSPPSEGVAILAASGGYCGNYPSPEPSNTSTPPTSPTEPPADGLFRIFDPENPEAWKDEDPVTPLP